MNPRLAWSWVALLGTAAAIFCIATRAEPLTASVLVTGTLCVALIAIGRREGYLVGLYASAAYAWLAYQNGLYGEVWLNLTFYLPTGLIGFAMWSRHRHADQVVAMRALSWPVRSLIAASCLLGIGALGWMLSLVEGQNTPYIDAATNVLSVIATLLMMWRYQEQWLLYMALNVLSIIMWVLRWQAAGTAGDAMVVMWSLFLANSVFGWWRWSRGVAAARHGATS